ncbi:hypothetical protein DPMN_014069 [Dreissena polymorpha]|uniref:Uncharacterized protein n=1 Tax=Dreissena polymorpha TaxID=45954 RepID=A0A9D4N5B9_DREPO|nr:hypothetical protein DPMN_014069 [Dreissena polymorpha]
MLKLAQTNQPTDQPTNRPTNRPTDRALVGDIKNENKVKDYKSPFRYIRILANLQNKTLRGQSPRVSPTNVLKIKGLQ